MPDIYDQHKAAFANVSAYVIARNGEKVATIAFKYPRDGAGRLYAYVHWLGVPMVRGFAGGCGYDKHSAAVADAARKIIAGITTRGVRLYPPTLSDLDAYRAFLDAIERDGGWTWESRLREAGFQVWSAV